MNEVYPWSPSVKEHDRANIHLYRLIGYNASLSCYRVFIKLKFGILKR